MHVHWTIWQRLKETISLALIILMLLRQPLDYSGLFNTLEMSLDNPGLPYNSISSEPFANKP